MFNDQSPRAIIFIFYLSFFTVLAFAQISHGGQPLPLEMGGARMMQASQIPFVEMEPISNQSALWRSEQDNNDFRSLEFAHKFFVRLHPDNSGVRFSTADMQVWRVGIRSKQAYSLNILFSKFRIPEGAKVFVYNSDQTEVLGSYTHKNNSDLDLLPVQPINGDELIVEYQEPINAAFKGEVEIGEVNHDFRGILRATEPRDPSQNCHPNIVCYPEDIEPGSGVVALIINGTNFCTGVLVNNSANDRTPYLLTATHCINNDYWTGNPAKWEIYGTRGEWHYNKVSGSIIAFFGYQSPVCNKEIRGNVQMSMVSLDSVLVLEKHDISLLKFKEIPPAAYQPYYLGWNISSSPQAPYHGIHQPNGGIKKVAIENDALAIGSFGTSYPYNMEPNAHWEVRAWDVGATEGGSSGSPLLDKEKRIIGTLTGGESYCSSPKGPDVYASLHKAWLVENSLDNPNALKDYLDPENTPSSQIDGLNPYADKPYTKSSNYLSADTVTETYHNTIPMFATNNTLGYSEFAEEFYASSSTTLTGVYITSASNNNILNLNIKIKVYADNNGAPGVLLHEEPLNYLFEYYQNGGFHQSARGMRYNVENYVRFSAPIHVSGRFFVAYSDDSGISSGFSVLNVVPRKIGSKQISTAWMRNAQGWVRANENIEKPINTSLMISAYVAGSAEVSIPYNTAEKPEIKAYYNKENKRIFIESNKDLISWEGFSVSGRKVFEGEAEKSINRYAVQVDHLPAGVYLLKVAVDGKSETLKVLVR